MPCLVHVIWGVAVPLEQIAWELGAGLPLGLADGFVETRISNSTL